MSYDLRLYFPQQEFPYQEWHDLLALFHAVPHQDEFRKSPLPEWVIGIDSERGERVRYSSVWIDLRVNWTHNPDGCAPTDTHWIVVIETSGSASAKAVWTQFAIVYYALELMEGVTAHDCQWHSSDNLYSFTDPKIWRKFASVAFPQRAIHDPLTQQGLINEIGEIVF